MHSYSFWTKSPIEFQKWRYILETLGINFEMRFAHNAYGLSFKIHEKDLPFELDFMVN